MLILAVNPRQVGSVPLRTSTVVEVTLLLPKRNLTKVFFEGCSRSVVDVGPPSPSNRQPPTLSRLSQPGEGGG